MGRVAVRLGPGRATPGEDPAALSRRLWDVEGWAAHGWALLGAVAEPESARQALTLNAAVVRHLRVDPALPADLLPPGWPSEELRAAYANYSRGLLAQTLQVG